MQAVYSRKFDCLTRLLRNEAWEIQRYKDLIKVLGVDVLPHAIANHYKHGRIAFLCFETMLRI